MRTATVSNSLTGSVKRTGELSDFSSWSGAAHLMMGSFEEGRGSSYAENALKLAREFLGDLQGKDLADVGSGCGPTLESFRAAIGAKARLFSVETDPFALDVVQALAQNKWAVTTVEGAFDDVRLPEKSVDILIMTGVHFGYGLKGTEYQRITLPWFRSMARALRPGGIMIIDEGAMELLDRFKDMVEKIERAGLKKLAFRIGLKDGLEEGQFVLVFKRPSESD